MSFLSKAIISLISLILLLDNRLHASRQEELSQLRYLSFIIMDRPPLASEAQSVYRGEQSLDGLIDEWLASPEHLNRIGRYFRDMLGSHDFFFIADDAFFLKQAPEGHYYSEQKGNCAANQRVDRPAWWLASRNELVSICSNIASNNISVTINDTYYGCTWSDGFLRAGCGCGPEQILCFPETMRLSLMDDFAQEFPQRSIYAYEQNLSWRDLLAAPYLFGNRAMYLFYLQTQYVMPWQASPSDEQLAAIYAIPLDQKVWTQAPFQGAARSGVVTNPAFMRRFNNFRSRIRAVTDALLCREIDGSLNTDGIQYLVNPDVKEFDQQIVSREACASCHLGMDNMGAHIFGWNDLGVYQRWPQEFSQIGHAFGVSGEGPEDLMESVIDNGPGFMECMAKKAWEDFTGQSWNILSDEERQTILADTSLGPRDLIQAVLRSPAALRSRVSASDPAAIGSDAVIDFTSQVNPILTRSCSGSACHGVDSSLGSRYQFVDHEAGFRGAPLERLLDGSMPPASSILTINALERQILLKFLAQ